MKKIEQQSLIAHSSSEIFWWMLFGLAVVELKCVLTPPLPQKKISGSTPEHYKWSSGRHVPLFKIINLTKIMRTYELYHWSLKCQEVIWSDYFHLISLCILINKTDLFFSGLNMHHLFLWQIVSQERRHKIG